MRIMTLSSKGRVATWIGLCHASLAISCITGLQAAEPASVSDHRVTPETLRAASEYSARHGGAAVLVMKQGKIEFERYESPVDATTAIHLHSGTKGFWGPVIAAMIDDKLVGSFDEKASATLPGWRNDPRKREITLRQLLELNAGLAQDLAALQGHARATLAQDLYAHAIKLPMTDDPGRRFVYGPSCYYALGEIMKRKLAPRKQTPLEYLRARILKPIGVEVGSWVHDQAGNPHIPNGASLTARNWARFGYFLLQEGSWEGKQIVSRALMRELRKPSGPNPGHGLAIWLNTPGGWTRSIPAEASVGGFIYPDGEPELFAALGAGKNRLYIIPRLQLMVVRQNQHQTDEYQDREFLRLLLGNRAGSAPPAVAAESTTTASPKAGADRLRQTFGLLDKDGDGGLSTKEAGDRPFFKPADADRDGIVTLAELREFFRSRGKTAGAAKREP